MLTLKKSLLVLATTHPTRPQTAPPLALSGEQLIEWGGAQRWLCSALPAAQVRQYLDEVLRVAAANGVSGRVGDDAADDAALGKRLIDAGVEPRARKLWLFKRGRA